MTYYIAGPMTGLPDYNFDAFDAAAARLRAAGHTVINPAELDRLHEGWGQYPPAGFVASPAFRARCLRRDLCAIADMPPGQSSLYLLRGWEQSRGAQAETSLGVALGFALRSEEWERT